MIRNNKQDYNNNINYNNNNNNDNNNNVNNNYHNKRTSIQLGCDIIVVSLVLLIFQPVCISLQKTPLILTPAQHVNFTDQKLKK